MFKTIIIAAAAAAVSLSAPQAALAGGIKAPQSTVTLAQAVRSAPSAMPPASHSSQWWTHPAGCKYSRAGRPGEVVWFLTSVPRGASCPEFIVQKKIDDSYRQPFMIDG
jgi:hypothetical protein